MLQVAKFETEGDLANLLEELINTSGLSWLTKGLHLRGLTTARAP